MHRMLYPTWQASYQDWAALQVNNMMHRYHSRVRVVGSRLFFGEEREPGRAGDYNGGTEKGRPHFCSAAQS